jgi:putative peptidoglycan lipid II flippase
MKLPLLRKAGSDTTNRKIFRAAAIVGSLAFLGKLAATIKELIIARSFGRSDGVDAFLIAFLLPVFVLNVGMSALGYVLVPMFLDTRQKLGREAAQRLLSSILLLGCAALVAIAGLLGLLAPFYLPLLGHGFSPAKLALTRKLLYLLLPWIVFSGVANLSVSILNACEKFALPALVSLVTPVVTIGLVVFEARHWGIVTLAGGAVIGGAIESALLLHFVNRKGLQFSLRWHGFDAGMRTVLTQYAPMLTGSILMGSTAVVDQAMAALLPSGSVAALGYANKMILGGLSISTAALGTASLPYLSRMVAAGDWASCRHTLKRYSALIVGTTVPFALLVILFSRPIIKLMFERGAFMPADTELVSRVQICYAIQIPFYIWNMIFVCFISAVRRNSVLMYVSALALVLDVILNLALMRRWGVTGIALSTSIVCMVSFLILSLWSFRFLAQEGGSPLAAAPQPEASH